MSKRKSPIAKNLFKNSVAGMFSAIEIHNKPMIEYRYEMVVLLVLNSWELLLKAYLYKFLKIKLFNKDGTTKPFENCLKLVSDKQGKEFSPVLENLMVLYGYRNQVAHFYLAELDPIMFSLISKNIIFYSKFVKEIFKYDIGAKSNLILLPIGFRRPISPIDYISNASISANASTEVKEFILSILNATSRLNNESIQETIFVEFKMNLTNVSRIKNADLIAGIDNSKDNDLMITTKKETFVRVGENGDKVVLSRDRAENNGTVYFEKLQDGIFDEINNVIDTNRLLANGKSHFVLGKDLYFRIYSERQYVSFNVETYQLLAEAAMLNLYTPFLHWLTKLPVTNVVDILFKVYEQLKSPNINNLLKVSCLLGSEATTILQSRLAKSYSGVQQKPAFYYTFSEICKSKQDNVILKALKTTSGKILYDKYSCGSLLSDTSLASSILSKECLSVFSGASKSQNLIRELDYLSYGHLISNNDRLLEEFIKRFP